MTTRLEDVDYDLPPYDEDGEQDCEAYCHRNLLALGRDFGLKFGLTGISDDAASTISAVFPELETATDVTPEIRNSMIELGKLIEQDNPEDPSTQDRIEEAIANLRDQLITT